MYRPMALADRRERHLCPPYFQTFPQRKVYAVHRKLRQHFEFYGWLAEEHNRHVSIENCVDINEE